KRGPDLRPWKKPKTALLIVLMLVVGVIFRPTEGQSQRARRVDETLPEKPSAADSNPSTKSAVSNLPQQQSPTKPSPQKPGKPPETSPELETESIRIDSNLVAVPVSVTDAEGQVIRNLKAEDFRLEEDGQTQQLQTLGEPGKTPIELALLFDVSRSVRNRFDFEREAAIRFLKEVLKPGDTVSIFEIGSTPKLTVERTEKVETAISKTQLIDPTEDSTAFFDTVVRAARYLDDRAAPNVRRVMVVISDGEDTNSDRFRLSDALRELQKDDSLFYCINPSGPSIRLNKISTRGHEGMVRLAAETGGVAFLPDKLQELDKVFAQITAELQAQYLLGYYPTNEKNDGQYRRISVKVPKREDLRIRARSGYYAPKQ
ncbi:MAG TPA: VWA domain-containing protein, partial [Blastocatellia bacterium]|nr:VWA domain-containing protein [Blastocatellia bacterium]